VLGPSTRADRGYAGAIAAVELLRMKMSGLARATSLLRPSAYATPQILPLASIAVE